MCNPCKNRQANRRGRLTSCPRQIYLSAIIARQSARHQSSGVATASRFEVIAKQAPELQRQPCKMSPLQSSLPSAKKPRDDYSFLKKISLNRFAMHQRRYRLESNSSVFTL